MDVVKKRMTFSLIVSYSLQRLQAKVIKLVDVSYGGENGFNQAIELAAESLQNVKFIQEKKLIGERAITEKFNYPMTNDDSHFRAIL